MFENVGGIMRDLDAEQRKWHHRQKQISLAAQSLYAQSIARTCARHELESDEFMTREEKAVAIIEGRMIA